MNNNIEDIYIGANYKSPEKKGGKIVLFFIIFLFIILLAMVALYWYFNNYTTTSTKQLFFNHLSNNNVTAVTSGNIFDELAEKLLTSNYEANSDISFTTNVKNDELEDIDVNKFTYDLKLQNNVNESKFYSELGINYSGNEELRVKLLANKDSIGIKEDQIVNKYVGVHYDNLKDLYGIDINQDEVNSINKVQKIDLSDEEIKEFFTNNISKISNMIPEEKFTIQDNIAIEKNDEQIPVTGYTLTLSQEEMSSIIVTLLKDIRSNGKLLEKIAYSGSTELVTDTNIDDMPLNEVKEPEVDNLENQVDGQDIEFDGEPISNLDPIPGEENEFNENQVILEENQDVGSQELELRSSVSLDPVGEENNEFEIIQETLEYEDFIRLLFGMKVNKSVSEVRDLLDSYIEKVNNMSGNGIVVTVYASNEKTEKISITLPNSNTIDLEILKKTDSENRVKITYLYEDSLEETNGISVEIDKITSSSSTSLDITCNIIEDEKINKKINIKSDFQGSVSSSNLSNSSVVTVSTKENETRVVCDTTFKFSKPGDIPYLVDDNCLFLETLSPEDYEITMQAIEDKIDLVWAEKKERFNLIDTNTRVLSGSKNNASSSVKREEAKQVLTDKISEMINEAQANETEFTLANLQDLKIEGYEVSSNVNENSAVIVVDIYTFNVDTEFNIIDAE